MAGDYKQDCHFECKLSIEYQLPTALIKNCTKKSDIIHGRHELTCER